MARSRNGHTVYDAIMSGWKRQVSKMNSQGTPVVSLPGEFVEDHDIDLQDKVALIEREDRDHPVLEVHFANK